MLPARFLKPLEVLEMDIHDMGARSEARNKHLLVIVDRASKFLFAYTLPNKTAENAAKKLVELLLNYGISLSLRSDPGTEFTPEVVQHLCKWLNATIDMALQTTQELRGLWRGWGDGSMKLSWSFGHPLPLTIRPRLPYPDGCYLTEPRRRGHGRTA